MFRLILALAWPSHCRQPPKTSKSSPARALQMSTIYAAAMATHAQNALDAAAPLADLRGENGREAARKTGLKPITE